MGRKNRSDKKRTEILEHLYEIISKGGIEEATLSKIAKHMGVHKSLLTYYFKTKEEMIISLVDFITDKYLRTFYDMVSRIEDPRKRLEASLDVIFSQHWVRVIDYRVFYSCFYLSIVNEKIRIRFKKMYDIMKEVLVKDLEIFKNEGIIEIENPEETAVFIISMIEGFDYYLVVSGYDRKLEDYSTYLRNQIVKMLNVKNE